MDAYHGKFRSKDLPKLLAMVQGAPMLIGHDKRSLGVARFFDGSVEEHDGNHYIMPKFYWLRGQNELRKKPSTSELIDWISVLLRSGISEEQLQSHIPFLGSLLKNEQDTESLTSYTQGGGAFPDKWSDLGPRFNQ